MPVLFLAHGAPTLVDDADWVRELGAWAAQLPRPKAVLMLSAHWTHNPVRLGATRPVPLVYDFSGFPRRYYETLYPAPGAPELAAGVEQLLAARGIATERTERGLDHGAYVPLSCMYPKADVPVLAVSLPTLAPDKLKNLGMALAPLADDGVLIVGSGFLTHNMQYAFEPGTPSWAREFDAWAEATLRSRDLDALMDFRAKAPGAALALPTWEHFAPVIVSAAAAHARPGAPQFPITGFWQGGAFTRRSVQFG
jgi:4,5-DOPA dioxygenase extradiol